MDSGRSRAGTAVVALLVLFPLGLFGFLEANPGLDPLLDVHLFHFYIVTFISYVAVVAALFVASASRHASDARLLLTTMAFAAVASIFLVHALATPGILIPGFNQAVGWSARLSLAGGAFFFVLSTLPWSRERQAWLVARRTLLWIAAVVVYFVYVVLAFAFPRPLETLSNMEPEINFVLAALVVGGYLWSAHHAWRSYQRTGSRIDGYLAPALILLAEAQIIQTVGEIWRFSWWLYHILMLVSFMMAVYAIAIEFEALRDFRAARYYAALGSVAAVGLALLSGELGVGWLELPGLRVPILTLVGLVTASLFGVSYAIILRADRLIRDRTVALQREQTARRELTNLIVHDLKNPLASIIGSLSAVSSGAAGALNDVQTRFTARSEEAARHGLRLIDDLLDVERLEAGVLKLEMDSLPLEAMLKARVEAMEGLAQKRDQTLALDLPADLPHPQGDRALLERVLDNLITNAIKYTPEGGRIEVRARASNGNVWISVADDGPGVPPTERQRIFEKFGQVAGTERRGAGLGLAFCKMTVEAHHGTIGVAENPGGGSVFTFSLPLRE